MPKRFPGKYIAEMYLNHGCVDGPDGVSQGNRSVCVRPGVQDYAVVLSICLLEAVNKLSLNIALKKIDSD